jgi:hypothetical protein
MHADMKQGLVLDKIVLLGRTFDEYTRYFALDPVALRGQAVLDVASGVSSFCAEAHDEGIHTIAFDLIYDLPPEQIQARCGPDLEHVLHAVRGLKTYRWEFYKSPENLRHYRERAYRRFLDDYQQHRGARYLAGKLPALPFRDRQFDLTLVSYLLFAYDDKLDYDFHKESVLEIMRVTRGEARLYPLVNFEAQRCGYLDLLKKDPDLRQFRFEEVPTNFEFLANSNSFLKIQHR